MKKLVLLLRRTKDYHEKHQISLGGTAAQKQRIMTAIGAWPFKVPYLEFRRRLSAISELTQTGFDQVVPWQNKAAVQALAPDTWLVPMDEDDWLAPNFAQAFRDESPPPRIRVMTWEVYRKQADGSRIKNTFVESCGYALQLPYSSWNDVVNHMRIKDVQHQLDRTLSVRNETVASLGVMLYRPETKLVETLKKAIQPPPKDLPPWCLRQYGLYQDLLREAAV